VLAYRLQSDALGDLDKSIRRILRSGKEDGVGAPFYRRAPQTPEGLGLKAGALLVREWKGKLERVMILEEGFAWNGQTFGSLSQIAKAMTGTNWSGHRFFGLRQGQTLAADARADRPRSRNKTAVAQTNGAKGTPPAESNFPSLARETGFVGKCLGYARSGVRRTEWKGEPMVESGVSRCSASAGAARLSQPPSPT
jgi:hypothetical protein